MKTIEDWQITYRDLYTIDEVPLMLWEKVLGVVLLILVIISFYL